jgi:hypothetical protein
MFLTVLALSLIGVVVCAGLFAAATHTQPYERDARPSSSVLVPPARFFDDGGKALPAIPSEALLLQIERHIQLEQAAAEAFLDDPTVESLHSRTISTLVH